MTEQSFKEQFPDARPLTMKQWRKHATEVEIEILVNSINRPPQAGCLPDFDSYEFVTTGYLEKSCIHKKVLANKIIHSKLFNWFGWKEKLLKELIKQ